MRTFFVSFLLLIILISTAAFSQVPKQISYQGILTDTTGNVKPNGEYNFTFRLYESINNGSALWSESKKLFVKKGLFSTNLGDQSPFGSDITFDKPYWLSIQIENETELSPRIALTSVGYSISSINSDTAEYAKDFNIGIGKVVKSINGIKNDVSLKGSGGTTINTNGNEITISSSGGNNTGIQSINNSDSTLNITNPNGPAVNINVQIPFKLNGSSDDYLISAVNSGYGYGIYGKSEGVGIYGESNDSYGVYGHSPKGVGVLGASIDNNGIYGGSNNSVGVSGQSNNASGIRARTYNPSSYALEAFNSSSVDDRTFGALASNEYGAIGQNNNSGNYGILGYNYNGVTAGVLGVSTGKSLNNIGVLGFTDAGGIAIEGEALNGDYAGRFYGNVDIVGGTLTYNNVRLKIDHPLDPANKYLIHSSVESPEMKNIYDGVVTTNANGSAIVDLPSYFQALNKDYCYQLTVIGQFAQAIIDSKIQNNRFIIKTDKPNVEVSWQVTGVRNDAYAKVNPMVVEQEKAANERGKYLLPELFGQPKDETINYVKPAALPELNKFKTNK